jgi:hypothetical protein
LVIGRVISSHIVQKGAREREKWSGIDKNVMALRIDLMAQLPAGHQDDGELARPNPPDSFVDTYGSGIITGI